MEQGYQLLQKTSVQWAIAEQMAKNLVKLSIQQAIAERSKRTGVDMGVARGVSTAHGPIQRSMWHWN